MKPDDVVRQHLPQVNVMQLATTLHDLPYLCTVHYYSDEDLNLYWCSKLESRHSQEIKQHPNVAAYVLAHENTSEEDYVIGMTIAGKAELVGAKIDPKIAKAYAKKLDHGPDFVEQLANDETAWKFYRLKPSSIVLFDNKNFPNNPRQELKVGI